jgi:hypothetical protein
MIADELYSDQSVTFVLSEQDSKANKRRLHGVKIVALEVSDLDLG